jgi:TP901 family phage tail tape measure protein
VADRTVKVGLKADVTSYISAIRAAERATERFADRAVADARRAQAALSGAGPAPRPIPGQGGAPGSGAGGAGPAGPAPRPPSSPSTASNEAAAAARARAEEERLARQADAMDTVGTHALMMGGAIAAGLGLSAKAAIDWESAWAGVTKTVDGSVEEMAALESELRGMAKTLPISHKEIAGVAEAAGQLGVKRQDIASFTKTMVDLGVSTNLSAEDASTAIAQMTNVMGTAPADVSRLGAALVALGNAGASTEADIMSMASRLSGAGKLVGATESGVLAMANAMSSVGIEAELGGGAMSRTLQKIYTSVKSGGPALENFAQIAGMSAKEFADAFQKDPMTAMAAFTGGLGRIKDEGGNVIAALDGVKIKGTQDLQVLLRLAGAGDLLADSLELGAEAWKENTALTDEAGKRYATVSSKLTVAKNNIVDLAIEIGDVLLPIIAKMADATGDVIRFIQDLPGPIRDVVVVLGGLVGGFALLTGALLLTVPRITAVRTALQTLAASAMWTQFTTNLALMRGGLAAVMATAAGPWVLAFAAAAAAVGALLLMNRKSKPPIDDLTAAIKADSGALDENTRKAVASRLEKEGALDLADKFGISLADVTAATMGNTEAQERLNDAIAAARAPHEEYLRKQQEIARTTTDVGARQRAQYEISKMLREGELAQLDKLSASVGTNADATRRATAETEQMNRATAEAEDQSTRTASAVEDQLNRAMGRASTRARDAAGGTAKLKQAVAQMGTSAKDAEKKLKDLSTAIDDLFEHSYGAPRALDAFHKALNDLGDQIKENGRRLRGNTTAAIDNRESLRDLAEKVGDYAQKLLEAGEPVDSVAKKIRNMRQDILDKAKALGLDRDEVKKLIGTLDDLPETVKVQLGVETAVAQTEIRRTQAMIDELHGRNIPINVAVSGSSLGLASTAGITRASGGIVHGPGGPRGDAIPAWLSDGEYVVNASATARHRPLLEHLNAGRFAAGGPAGMPGGGGWPASYFFAVSTAKQAEKALSDLGKRLDKVNDTLRADKLGQARKDAREMASAIRSAFVQGADITSLPNAGGSTGQMLGDLQGKLDRASAFTGAVDQLRRAGLNKTALDQIVAGGAEGGGLAAATQLLNDMGAIRRVNDLMGRISAEGAKLGAREAKAKYADAIRKAEADKKADLAERRRLVARKAQLTRIQREQDKAAEVEKDTVVKAKVKAASRVTSTGKTLSAVSSGASLAPIRVKVTFDVTGTNKHLKAWLRETVRVDGGGIVQKAFGT